SPTASHLSVTGDSSALTQVIVRSKPPAPASTSPLLNPPSSIASRTVSAMGVTSMPYRAARVKDQRVQELFVALHNEGPPLRLLAFPLSQPPLTGLTHPRSRWLGKRGGPAAASRVVPRAAKLLVPAGRGIFLSLSA